MKKLLILTIFTLILLTPALTIHAASVDVARSVLDSVTDSLFGEGESNIVVVIGRVIQAILGLIGVAFTALLIYGGIMYMTAAGNQEQVGKARSLIRDSVIGLAIIITSFAIAGFLVESLILAAGG